MYSPSKPSTHPRLSKTACPFTKEPYPTSSAGPTVSETDVLVVKTLCPPATAEAPRPVLLIASLGGVGVGRGPGLVATVDLRIPCPGFVGRSTSEEGSVSDGAGCNCFVGGVIRSNASGGGEAPGGCLSICSAIRTAARVRVVVLMEILYSVCAI